LSNRKVLITDYHRGFNHHNNPLISGTKILT
jgi:hypothetical protein